MSRTPNDVARRGFTLVELLVAAALSVLVMYVLAEAFKAGTDTLSQLKSVAGLADQLRTAETILRKDLKAQHLENDKGESVLVSDLGGPTPGLPASWGAPNRGFFKVVQGTQGTDELSDGNGINSRRAIDHWLQFTNKLTGRSSEEVFNVSAPNAVVTSSGNMVDFASASTFAGRWGEVTYFLQKQPNSFMPPDVTSPQDLFVLYRRGRVLGPPNTTQVVVNPNTTVTGANGFPDLSGFSQTAGGGGGTDWKMNRSDTITDPQFRTTKNPGVFAAGAIAASTTTPSPFTLTDVPQPIPANDTNSFGSDILLTNVVSMRIQVLDGVSTSSTFMQYIDPVPPSPPTPTWPRVWDTYLTNDAPGRILGIRIQLRVYDTKNMVTRQVTIAQPL